MKKGRHYKRFINLYLYEWGKMKSQSSFNMNSHDYSQLNAFFISALDSSLTIPHLKKLNCFCDVFF